MSRAYVTSLVVCVLLFCAATVFYVLQDREKKEKISLQNELTQVSDSQKKLDAELHEIQTSNATLQERIKFQEDKINELTQNMETAKTEREKAQAAALEKEFEIERLRSKIQDAEKEKQDLLDRMDKQYQEYYEMKSQLNSILKTKEELEKKAKELAENGPVSLGTVVIRQSSRAH